MKVMSVECKECMHMPKQLMITLFIFCLLIEGCFGGIMWWVGREQGRTERAYVDGRRAQVATEAIAKEERRLRRGKP